MACSRGCCATPAEHYQSLAVLGKRTRPIVREGKAHHESGKPWKSVTNEVGTITEHGSRLSGVSDRQDATVHIRETIKTSLGSPA